eukprot:ANDGO_00167.mRNA.1 3-ketodihydrosphingosine reductase
MLLLSLVGAISFLFWYFRPFKQRASFQGVHVFVSGGSSGIGKAVAIELARRGASITLAARNKERLEEARSEVIDKIVDRTRQKVSVVSVDVCDFEEVKAAAAASCNALGLPTYIIMSAGLSYPGYFADQDLSVHQKTMQLDYFGSLHVAKAFVDMKIKSLRAKEWANQNMHLVFFSSTAGMLSFCGFSTYSPAKFAVRGLAEVLRNELKPNNVQVSIVYPPDTDTPGYHQENKTKPEECAEISSWGGKPLDPEYVAKSIVDQLALSTYHISADPGTRLAIAITAGSTPRPSLLSDIVLAPVGVIVGRVFRFLIDNVITKRHRARERRAHLRSSSESFHSD